MYYYGGILYSANTNTITYVNIDESLFGNEKNIVDLSTLKIRHINTGLRVHGVHYRYGDIQFMFERSDYQLDFSNFKIRNMEDDKEHSYSFDQETEPLPRTLHKNDPIKKNIRIRNGA